MNKNLFRIIFNQRRGQLMAVAETSPSQGKGFSGESVASGHTKISDVTSVAVRALSFAVLCALGAVLWVLPKPSALAQVVAYRQAPSSQQPTILQTANGVPQVNIRTPSAAGVSHNVYSQFDVQRHGVILNNSRTNVQTQQGGWVQGNPWLATGSARVILNEVNSSAPSHLNGYVEVAGQRAEVVIANPSGISVNGGGFINTSKATLTTGIPMINSGSLDSYRVQAGNISINGNGLDLSTTDYAAILTRAVQVNAGIWANELKVVTGANQIQASSVAVNTAPITSSIAGHGAAPSFALDVAQIGGMYAGKIHLIGTEQGLGVRSAGTLGATGGDLVLQNNGWLTNTGSLQASANLNITTQGNITNGGTLYASNDQTLSATGTLTNSGVIAALGNTSINAKGLLSDSKSVLAAGIKTDGSLGNSGSLNVTTTQDLVANGKNIAAGNITLSASSIDLSSSQTSATHATITTPGKLNTAQSTLIASENLQVTSGDLNNAGGTLSAGKDADFQTAMFNNDSGLLQTGGNLTINTQDKTLTNSHAASYVNNNATLTGKGGIASQGTITLITGHLNNDAGYIGSKSALSITTSPNAGRVTNSNTLSTTNPNLGIEGNSVTIRTSSLANDSGAIRVDDQLNVMSSGTLNNNAGLMSSGNTLTLKDSQAANSRSLAISNTAGTLIASKNFTVAARTLSGDGKVLSLDSLSIGLNTDFDNSGQVIANGNVTFNSSGDVSNSGKLQAGGTLNLSAKDIHNTTTGEISAKVNQVNALSTLNNRGLIDGIDTQINAQTVNNIGTGRIYGDHLSIAAVNLTNDTETVANITSAGTIAARNRLDLGIRNTLTNREKALIYSVGDMAIGATLDSNRHATSASQTVNNNSATIEAGGNLDLATNTLNNTNEHFRTRVDLVSGPTYKNWLVGRWHQDHQTSTYNTVVHEYETKVDSSDPAQILVGGNMSIRGDQLSNDKSRIIVGGSLTGDLTKLNNIQAFGEKRLTESGTVTFTTHRWEGGLLGRGNYWTEDIAAYMPADVVTSITLPVTVQQTNTVPVGSGTQVGTRSQAQVSDKTSAAGGVNARHAVMSSPTLPTSSLYKANPSLTAAYLVETDGRFANNKQWLGSDYMTKSLSLDPSVTQKRLGDGFYEQKLIREQVAALTGRRFLADYTSEEQEYKALMNSAITFGQTYKLRPGIALTPQQVALLTSDIVWLVEQSVTLPNGTQQKVLVPQVYVKTLPGDLDANGTLLASKDLRIQLSDDLNNSGTIAGRNFMSLTAENVNNLGGRIVGNDVNVMARQDLNNVGGILEAVNSLNVNAGRDLNVESTTQSTQTLMGQRTSIDRVAGLYVSGEKGTLVASTGRDLNLTAAVVSNTGTGATSLTAQHDLNLGTTQTGHQLNIIWDAQNYRNQADTQEVGSQVTAGGNINLIAGQDIAARAANVQAKETLNANAGGRLQIEAGQATSQFDEAHRQTQKGFMSRRTVSTHETHDTTTAQASNFGGANVNLVAKTDIAIKGSNVVGDKDVNLTAKKNITIETDQNTSHNSSFRQETKSGLMSSGGFGVAYGKRMQSNDGKDQTITAAASTVGSVNGNVNIKAGDQYKQVGSDIATPNGDINIQAKNVKIQEARETDGSQQESKFEQSGITLAINSAVVSTVQSAQSQLKAATQTQDTRMKALAGASSAANVKLAADALKAGQGDANGMVKTGKINPDGSAEMVKGNAADKAGGIGVSVSIGKSSSQSKSTSQSDTARGSTVKAGGAISIQATGAGQDSDLTIQGSDVAGKAVNLEADNKVNLLAAQNTNSQTNSNSNQSASVGIAMQLGNSGGGIGFTGSVSAGSGSGNGSEITYTNTHVSGLDNVNIKSGGDTTLKGATVTGKTVKADVGGNLNIDSLQDTATYAEKNQQVGASGMIGAGMSGSANFAKSNINSNYASVTEQSGIKAGDGGFRVDVKGNTDLKGGAIVSTQAAVDQKKNTFNTGGTLTTSDIQNKASYEAKSVSVSVGTGGSPMPSQGLSSVLSGAGIGKDSGSTSSTTTAGISGVAGDSSKRTGDKEQGVAQIFNKEQVKAEINAQTIITQEFGKHASKAVGDYAQAKLDEARKNNDQAGIAAWSEGGANRVALHTVVGGLTFGAQGAIGAASSQAVLDQVGQAIQQTQLPVELKRTLVAAAGTAVGAATGGTAGAASGLSATVNNYLKHTELQSKQQQLAACKDDACKKQVITAWDKLSQERNTKTGNAVVSGTVNDNLKTMEQLSSDMKGLAQYKASLEDQLRSTSDPTQKANLQLQVNEADSSIRQIASQGKDALALLYQQTGDAKYQTAFQALSVATSGNEIGAALTMPSGSGGNVNKAVQEAKSGAQLAQTAKINALADEAQAANAKINKINANTSDSTYVAPTHTSKDNFQTHGLTTDQVPASIKNQMTKDLEVTFGAGSGAEKMAKELIESGRSVPVPMQATSDTKLYKLMANDDPRTPSSTTPYFVDAAQLQRLQKNPSLANDILGLPSSSQAPVFKVYEVQPQPNTTPTVYQSDVATATSKAGSAVVGNAKQTLVPDRSQWTEPKLTNIKIGGK